MAKLPTKDYLHYWGVDPGFSGAIGCINAAGTGVTVYDMPLVGTGGKDRQREFDLDQLDAIIAGIGLLPNSVLGIEWPTTRPGEGAERAERFGRGKGLLQAFAHARKLDYYLLAPNLWKGRLGVPGKSDKNANKIAAKLFTTFYPEHADLIHGPRGGVKDGRCDALLIAHFLRARSFGGMSTVIEKFGKDSPEAWALALGGGRRKKDQSKS